MKRLLPLIALALLLLAPAARGGDLEDRENAVQESAAQVELLLVELDQTKDAPKRAELQLRIDAARANWNTRKSELEVVRTQLAQAAAEHEAEDTRRARTAAEIAKRAEEAEVGIEAAKKTRVLLVEALQLASTPENVKEIKRLQARMATFEEHAAKFHIAKGWLDKARALLETADILEAQKALVQAKAHLQKAARRPLDDGSDTRPAPEFRTQRAAIQAAAALQHARDVRAVAETSVAAAERVRKALALQTSGESGLAVKREEVERLQQRIEEVRAELVRLQAARDALEQARPLIDDAEYQKAKRAFEDAKNRLEAVNGIATSLRASLPSLAVLEASIRDVESEIAALKARGLTDEHSELKQRYRRLDVLRKHLERAQAGSAPPYRVAVQFGDARQAALHRMLAEREAQLATLTSTHTDKHPEVVRLQREIDGVKKQLAKLESTTRLPRLVVRGLEGRDGTVLQPYDPKSGESPPNLRVVTDKDGRLELVGGNDGKHRVRIVTGDSHVVTGRILDEDGKPVRAVEAPGPLLDESGKPITPVRVVGPVLDEDGKPVKPVIVTKTVTSTLRRRWTPHDAELRKQIDHLKKAAALLREAGQDAEAKRLEDKAIYLQTQLGPSRVYTTGATNGEVMRAIGDLRTEVRALRKEVKELKALILQGR